MEWLLTVVVKSLNLMFVFENTQEHFLSRFWFLELAWRLNYSMGQIILVYLSLTMFSLKVSKEKEVI